MPQTNMENISHIIFDWDGTVMDSADKIVNCMQAAAKLSNLDLPTAAAVKSIIGISLLPAIMKLFAVNEAKAEEVKLHYKRIYFENQHTPCKLFSHAHEALSKLANTHTLGIATGKARKGLEDALASSNTHTFFDKTVTADDAESKPSPDMLLQLLEHWKIPADQALMIGDTTYDMKMAEDIGMARVGVSYGAHEINQLKLHNPVEIIHDLRELVNLVGSKVQTSIR